MVSVAIAIGSASKRVGETIKTTFYVFQKDERHRKSRRPFIRTIIKRPLRMVWVNERTNEWRTLMVVLWLWWIVRPTDQLTVYKYWSRLCNWLGAFRTVFMETFLLAHTALCDYRTRRCLIHTKWFSWLAVLRVCLQHWTPSLIIPTHFNDCARRISNLMQFQCLCNAGIQQIALIFMWWSAFFSLSLPRPLYFGISILLFVNFQKHILRIIRSVHLEWSASSKCIHTILRNAYAVS